MLAARSALSALRVPRTRIASPLLRTTSRMNLFDGLILSRSVLGTPAELEPRRRIALTNQVHPERILDLRRQLVRRDRQPLRLGRLAHAGLRRVHPRGHHRLLGERIGRDDMDRLGPLLGRQLADGEPYQLQPSH